MGQILDSINGSHVTEPDGRMEFSLLGFEFKSQPPKKKKKSTSLVSEEWKGLEKVLLVCPEGHSL